MHRLPDRPKEPPSELPVRGEVKRAVITPPKKEIAENRQ